MRLGRYASGACRTPAGGMKICCRCKAGWSIGEQRDALRQHLSENGIGTLIQWNGTPVHQMRELGFTETPPATEQFFKRCFMLPMHTALSDDDIAHICDVIQDFYRKAA